MGCVCLLAWEAKVVAIATLQPKIAAFAARLFGDKWRQAALAVAACASTEGDVGIEKP